MKISKFLSPRILDFQKFFKNLQNIFKIFSKIFKIYKILQKFQKFLKIFCSKFVQNPVLMSGIFDLAQTLSLKHRCHDFPSHLIGKSSFFDRQNRKIFNVSQEPPIYGGNLLYFFLFYDILNFSRGERKNFIIPS